MPGARKDPGPEGQAFKSAPQRGAHNHFRLTRRDRGAS